MIDLKLQKIIPEKQDSNDSLTFCMYNDMCLLQLEVVEKLIKAGVSKEQIQELVSDDISNYTDSELLSIVDCRKTQLLNSYLNYVSSEGLWTSIVYTFTSDSKVATKVDEATKTLRKYNNQQFDKFLNKKVTTLCFTNQVANNILSALAAITSGLSDYFNLIHQCGWIFQPDDVERVKKYDPMQFNAIMATLKPLVAKGDKIYESLEKGNLYDKALTGVYSGCKSASLTDLGFNKSSILALMEKHAKESAGCKRIIGELMNLCGNYGYDTKKTYTSVTEQDDEGNRSSKQVETIQYIARKSFANITKIAQLAMTIYKPIDKFIYAITKNVI